MRRLIVISLLIVATAACGGGDTSTTEPSQFPTGSVRSWFEALEENNTAGALELTHEKSMLMIIGAENNMSIEDLASLLRRGATDESAERYLASFAESLRDRYGSSLNEITVEGFTQLGERFAAVTVTGEGSATIVARRVEGGLWQVDLVGTVGPALISQIRDLFHRVEDGPDADTIREVFRMDVMPALEAAALNDPANLVLASEVRVMASALAP